MDRQSLAALVERFLEREACCRLSPQKALRPELAGMPFFDQPLIGVADASDLAFADLQLPDTVGGHFDLPDTWLPGARSVISIFLPFTQQVREANALNMGWPAQEWLHARIEGQVGIDALARELVRALGEEGYPSVAPSVDGRFWSRARPAAEEPDIAFTSNWSERHVAYVCGLGTFGLSAGLITRKGMAGRFLSVITTLELPADERPYQEWDEWCTHCGACAKNCPAGAISLGMGKDHEACKWFLDKVMDAEVTHYGCGKCQVRVPCESRAPVIRTAAAV